MSKVHVSDTRFNGYHTMWLFVFFDLPTTTKKDRKAAQGFRAKLLKDGFSMMQYSVYVRHCASLQSADVHVKRVKGFVTGSGQVSIMKVTDKQYGDMINYWGFTHRPPPASPNQLEMF